MGNIPCSYVVPTRRQNNKPELSIIILAANSGYRMRSYGPKSLLNITEKENILDYQVNTLKIAFPKTDIVLVIGFYADRMIKKCPENVRIIENQLFETTNEVEQIRLAFNNIFSSNVLIIKDDIVFGNHILNRLDRSCSCIVYDDTDIIDSDNVGVTVVDNVATVFKYNIDNKWCNILYLIEKDLLRLKTICSNRERSNLYLFEALNILIEKSVKLKAIKTGGDKIVKIDTIKDLGKIKV